MTCGAPRTGIPWGRLLLLLLVGTSGEASPYLTNRVSAPLQAAYSVGQSRGFSVASLPADLNEAIDAALGLASPVGSETGSSDRDVRIRQALSTLDSGRVASPWPADGSAFPPALSVALSEFAPKYPKSDVPVPVAGPKSVRPSWFEVERRTPIPEPASIVLLATGLIGLALRRHLRRNLS